MLSDDELLAAFRQLYGCLSIGSGCLITVRDYEAEEQGTNIVKPYGARIEKDRRYLIFQVWDFKENIYDLTFFFIEEDLANQEVVTHTMRSRYYAVSTSRLCELMKEAGFQKVRRIDDVFYQPVLVGTRAA